MLRSSFRNWLVILSILLLANRVQAAPDAKAIFDHIWEHYDQPVAAGQATRSWTWGPAPNTQPLWEEYFDETISVTRRQVQYFDKGRMELTNPAGNPADPWFVTSGLLPIELMTGSMQNNANGFDKPRESYITAIGDPGGWPTYPDLLPLYESPGTLESSEVGRPATDFLNRDLTISIFTRFASDPATIIVSGPNNHGVPQAFADFQRQQGPVLVHGGVATQQVYDPLFIFGLPITPPVWVEANIGGGEVPVLIQVFERRVLTYNPANAVTFRVEMGNVGQHYYQWRYQGEQAGEWKAWTWNNREVRPAQHPEASYVLEAEVTDRAPGSGSGSLALQDLVYRVYFTPDKGATRELRYTGSVLGCRYVNVALLTPRDVRAALGRIGLATQCTDDGPTDYTVGVTVKSSYDGGRTFRLRYQP